MTIFRRSANVLIFLFGFLATQGAAATTNFHANSTGFTRTDALGGGSVSTSGVATNGGALGSTATASSDSEVAGHGVGSWKQCATTRFGQGGLDYCQYIPIGSNYAQRYSILSALFTGLAAGTYQATITLSVSGVSDPAANYETGHLLDECFLEQGVDPPPANVQGYLCAGETGGEVSTEDTGTVKVGVDGVQGSRSDSSLNLIASARTVRVTEEEAAADSSGFVFISKDTQGDNCHKRTGTTTSSCELLLRPGTLQLTLDFALSSPGIAVVQVRLIAEAWASGKNADSSAGCHLSVTSIEVASV